MAELETLREIREVNSAFPCTAPVKAHKEKGGKVVAWQCTYVPEELIWAAGLLPVRMTGDSKELELGDANSYLSVNNCSFCRSCLQMVLDKEWDFLDGYVSAATCDGSRRLADIWQYYISIPLLYTLHVPRKTTESAHQNYLAEVQEMKRRLESHFGVKITDDRLREAIQLFNRMRVLVRELSELMKADRPPITGAEALEVINASGRMPKDQFNRVLERLLEEAKSGKRAVEKKARILLTGSPLNNPEFIQTIEGEGALVVVNELCTGLRYWWGLVAEDAYSDPLEAISRRYLSSFPCARMQPYYTRLDEVLALAKAYRVDGVVSEAIRYCQPYGFSNPLLRRRLEDAGIPMLELDVEYGVTGSGQIRTRVQAFLETIEGRESRLKVETL